MKPLLKWTLIVFAALVVLCLASPLAFAKSLAEDELSSAGFTSISVERKGPLTFGCEAFDKTGRKCSGSISRGYL